MSIVDPAQAREVATYSTGLRRLFQVNTQPGATGVLLVDEVTLRAERVIGFGNNNATPWGMAVDEPNRLLFAALDQSAASV